MFAKNQHAVLDRENQNRRKGQFQLQSKVFLWASTVLQEKRKSSLEEQNQQGRNKALHKKLYNTIFLFNANQRKMVTTKVLRNFILKYR